MKRLFIICSILLLMCSCKAAPQQDLKVLFVTKTLGNDYHNFIVKGAEGEAQQNAVVLDVFAPKTEDDYLTQIKYLEDALKSKKYSALMLAPNHSKALLPKLKEFDDLNIPFIIVDTPIVLDEDAEFKNYCGYVGTDNLLGGSLAAKFIESKLGKGNVLLIRGVHTHRTSQDRERGFVEEIIKSPAFKIIGSVQGDWEGKRAVSGLKEFLAASKTPVDAIFAYNDLMATEIADYYGPNKSRPIIVGYNGSVEAQKKILEGVMDASVVQTPDAMGRLAFDKLFECMSGSAKPAKNGEYLTPVTLIKATRALTTISDVK